MANENEENWSKNNDQTESNKNFEITLNTLSL